MRHPQGLRGLALPAPLRRFCSHCASPAAPGSGGSRDLRGWRRAGGRDGAAGNRCLRPTRTARPQCPPCAPTRAPRRRCRSARQIAARPRPWRAARSTRQKKGSAVGGRGWTCRPRGGVGRGSVAPRAPVRPPTRRRRGHLPRSTSAPRRRRARGAAQAAGAEELPDRERDKPFAKPRVHSSAGPPG